VKTTVKKIGLEQIKPFRPCLRALTDYSVEIAYGWDSWIHLLKDDSIKLEDRIWVGIRALPDDKQKRLFTCWCAEQALNCIHPSKWDARSLKAIEVAKRFAHGKATLDELREARSAAYAADAAATYATYATYATAAAYDAAATAAAYAADDAADDAADAAATYATAAAYDAAAAAYAAREKMRQKELKRLIWLHKNV
jgi:hypothetical protein